MKKYRILLLILIAVLAILYFRSCSGFDHMTARQKGINVHNSYMRVPADAAVIIAADIGQLMTAVDYPTLRTSPLFQEKLAESYQDNPPFTYIFSDPKGTGIDVNSRVTFYISLGEDESEIYSNTIIPLADVNLFAAAMEKIGLKDIQRHKSAQYAAIRPNTYVAWDDNSASFFSTKEGLDTDKLLTSVFADDQIKYFDTDQRYLQHLDTNNAEVLYWIDLDRYKKNPIIHTKKLNALDLKILGDNIIYGAASFGDGTVNLDMRFHFNKLLSPAIRDVLQGGMKTTMLNYLPDEQPSFLSTFSLNIDGILKHLLSDSDIRLEARNSLVDYGLTLDDFSKAFTGQLLFAAFPADVTDKGSAIFAAEIADPARFQSIMKVLSDLNKIEQLNDNMYRSSMGVIPFFPLYATYNDQKQRILIKDNYMFVSLDKRLIDQVIKGTTTPNHMTQYLSERPPSALQMSAYATARYDQVKQASEKYSIKDFNIAYGDQHLTLHFNLIDANRPALQQIVGLR